MGTQIGVTHRNNSLNLDLSQSNLNHLKNFRLTWNAADLFFLNMFVRNP